MRLLQLADLAMYDAKISGKNRYAVAQQGLLSSASNVMPIRAGQN
jgi:hypothetical protein